MNNNSILYTVKNYSGSTCILVVTFLLFSIFFIFSMPHSVYGVELFSGDEPPFRKSYDDWVSKYWNWWIAKSKDEIDAKKNTCLINKSDNLTMLMETTVTGTHHQVCKISSSQGIMIPLWIGWCDTGDPRNKKYSDEELTNCARERYNLGEISSKVNVDGLPVADLHVKLSPNIFGDILNLLGIKPALDYKIYSLANVTELYSKGFNLTIPPNSNKVNGQDVLPGPWRAGSHGWWVFLKSLPPGEHTVSYNVRNPGYATSAEITYSLQVE
jgi:hypothetical protein